MSREKQIKEMQNALIEIAEQPIMIEGLADWSDVIAEALYNAGYRKASEVAREIIEDIVTLLEANWNDIQHGLYWLTNGRCLPLRELLQTVEKKYTEGEG